MARNSRVSGHLDTKYRLGFMVGEYRVDLGEVDTPREVQAKGHGELW